MDKLKWIYETLECCIHEELNKGVENVDTQEMGEVVDMLKDIAEAWYYVSVAKAMEEKGEIIHTKPSEITLDMYEH